MLLIHFATKHSWEARDVAKDGQSSDDDTGLRDLVDLEQGRSDSPEDDGTDSEHQDRDEPSELRLSDEWDIGQYIQHSPEPWSPPPLPQSPPIEPAPASPKVPVDNLPRSAPTNEGTDNHPFTLDGPITHIGRKQKGRDLHAILEVCTCGEAVTDEEISTNKGIIRCESAGCETRWVSQNIP